MNPYYQDDAVTIYHGDCRDVLPMPSDAVVTDPPYGIGFSEYASHDDDPSEYPEFIAWAVETCERSLRSDGWCVFFQAPKLARRWHSLIDREWLIIAMGKTFSQVYPGFGVHFATDFALAWKVGEPKFPSGPDRPRDYCVVNTSNMVGRPDHPCNRPIGQMYHLMAFCPPGGVVLDPFMGSGTTLRAAKDLGRKAIGIEIEEKYCEIAAKRMAQEVLDFSEAK